MDFVLDFMTQFGVPAVLLLIFLEYACFPLPSEIVLPFAGAAAALGGHGFLFILFASVFAGLGGSLVCYVIGRYGGRAVLDWITRKFPKTKAGLEASERQFEKYASFAVGIGRVIPLCRTYISIIAGLSRQPLPSFIGFSSLGIVVWNFILILLGYLLGDNWEQVAGIYDQFKWPILLIAALLVGGFIGWKLWKRKRAPKDEPQDNSPE